MTTMRILAVDHTAQESGAELALLRLLEELRGNEQLSARVLLLAEGPFGSRLAEAGIRTATLPLDPRVATTSRSSVVRSAPRSALAIVGFVPRLARAIRISGADLVVANSLKAAVLVSLAAPLAHRPWIWHLHDRLARDYLPRPLVAAMRALAATGPRCVVANSEATRATLPRRVRERAVVAYPGLPSAAFRERVPDRDGTVVGIIGRISPTKGQREFLEAAATVAASRPDLRFAVIGGALFGEQGYEEELRDIADRLGIADRVDFTGWASDAPRRLRGLGILVHASPVPEPFGQVVVEAMAAGVPVIATAAGGVPEILDPDSDAPVRRFRMTATGALVAPGDPEALASAIAATLDDPVGGAARSAAARRDAAARFGIATTAEVVTRSWRAAARPRRHRGRV